jgi:hypothetical protein
VIVRSASKRATFVDVASKLRPDASVRQNDKEVLQPLIPKGPRWSISAESETPETMITVE